VSRKPERTRVTFDSGGVELVGYLYHAAGVDGDAPCVLMGHGFGGTQDRLFVGAERFAAVGLAARPTTYPWWAHRARWR
jgi:dienelactone hydrolase